MQELTVQFKPTNGNASRTIVLRIGTPVKEHEEKWSALIEVLGFDDPYVRPVIGIDWAQALELAAKIVPIVLDLRVHEAGGGDLDPSFYHREADPPDLSKLQPEIAAIFNGPHALLPPTV